jgi:hypothetical protein
VEYYSVFKKNEIMLFAGKWIIMVSEISQTQKGGVTCSLSYMESFGKMKVEGSLLKNRKKSSVCRGEKCRCKVPNLSV